MTTTILFCHSLRGGSRYYRGLTPGPGAWEREQLARIRRDRKESYCLRRDWANNTPLTLCSHAPASLWEVTGELCNESERQSRPEHTQADRENPARDTHDVTVRSPRCHCRKSRHEDSRPSKEPSRSHAVTPHRHVTRHALGGRRSPAELADPAGARAARDRELNAVSRGGKKGSRRDRGSTKGVKEDEAAHGCIDGTGGYRGSKAASSAARLTLISTDDAGDRPSL